MLPKLVFTFLALTISIAKAVPYNANTRVTFTDFPQRPINESVRSVAIIVQKTESFVRAVIPGTRLVDSRLQPQVEVASEASVSTKVNLWRNGFIAPNINDQTERPAQYGDNANLQENKNYYGTQKLENADSNRNSQKSQMSQGFQTSSQNSERKGTPEDSNQSQQTYDRDSTNKQPNWPAQSQYDRESVYMQQQQQVQYDRDVDTVQQQQQKQWAQSYPEQRPEANDRNNYLPQQKAQVDQNRENMSVQRPTQSSQYDRNRENMNAQRPTQSPQSDRNRDTANTPKPSQFQYNWGDTTKQTPMPDYSNFRDGLPAIQQRPEYQKNPEINNIQPQRPSQPSQQRPYGEGMVQQQQKPGLYHVPDPMPVLRPNEKIKVEIDYPTENYSNIELTTRGSLSRPSQNRSRQKNP